MSDDIKDLIKDALLEMLGKKNSDFSFRESTKVIYVNRKQKEVPGMENCLWYFWNHDKDCAGPIVGDSIVCKLEKILVDDKKTYKGKQVQKVHAHVVAESGQRYRIELGLETVSAKCLLSGLLMLARKLKSDLLTREIGIQVAAAEKSEEVVYINLFNPQSGNGVRRDEGLYDSIVAASAIAEINQLITENNDA